jgi:hypothetical protein
MTDKHRTYVICQVCQYRWQTKCADPTQAQCPECAKVARAGGIKPAPKTKSISDSAHPEAHDVARKELERQLARDWTHVKTKWLERGDQLFQDHGRRILVDEVGVFLYAVNGAGWQRLSGLCHYNLGLIGKAFGKGIIE